MTNNSWGESNARLEPAEGPHGGRAQRIYTQGFKGGAAQFVQSGIPVRKGAAYAIRVWLKGDVQAPVAVRLRQRGAPYTTYAERVVNVTPEWREFAFTLTSLADDPDAYFMIGFSSEGEVFVAGASLAPAAVDATAKPQVGNLVANGGFEVGLDRWSVLVREHDYAHDAAVSLGYPDPSTPGEGAKEGRRYLKIGIPEFGQLQLTSPYMRLNPGREHILSLWLSSSAPRKVRFGLGSELFPQRNPIMTTIETGPVWQRHTLKVTPGPALENAYFVLLETQGGGEVRIDDVRLTEGPDDGQGKAAEVGFWREGVGTVREIGEKVEARAVISSRSGRGQAQFVIRDFDHLGQETELLRESVSLAPGKEFSRTVRLPADEPRYHRLQAQLLQDGKPLDTSEMALAIVPKAMPDPESPFGGHLRFRKTDLDNARRLGVGWVRLHPPLFTKWFVVEPEKGRFRFQDEPAQAARKAGLRILGLLDTTAVWASTVPRDEQGQPKDSPYPYPPWDMKDWERYVFETVKHYRGVIDHWEVWNEPDAGGFLKAPGWFAAEAKPKVYAELLKVAHGAAKRANPDVVILGGCPTHQPPSKWFEKLTPHGAMPSMDVMSFHRYTDGRPGDTLETTTRRLVEDMRALAKRSGGPQRVWESESGLTHVASSYSNVLLLQGGAEATPMEAAAYLVRNHVHLLASGVERWFYYGMFPNHRVDRAEFCGFFEYDGSPRPTALAHAVMADQLRGAKFSHHVQAGDEVEGEAFVADDRMVYVLWAKGWKEREVSARVPWPEGYARAEVVDIMGNRADEYEPQQAIMFFIGVQPCFLRLSKK